jgi:hypothetical protein
MELGGGYVSIYYTMYTWISLKEHHAKFCRTDLSNSPQTLLKAYCVCRGALGVGMGGGRTEFLGLYPFSTEVTPLYFFFFSIMEIQGPFCLWGRRRRNLRGRRSLFPLLPFRSWTILPPQAHPSESQFYCYLSFPNHVSSWVTVTVPLTTLSQFLIISYMLR